MKGLYYNQLKLVMEKKTLGRKIIIKYLRIELTRNFNKYETLLKSQKKTLIHQEWKRGKFF